MTRHKRHSIILAAAAAPLVDLAVQVMPGLSTDTLLSVLQSIEPAVGDAVDLNPPEHDRTYSSVWGGMLLVCQTCRRL